MLITGSWDFSLKFWDRHASAGTSNANADIAVSTHVAGMASRLFYIHGIRKMVEPVQTRESSLKFMTRNLACMADGKGALFSYSLIYHLRRVGRLTLTHIGHRLCDRVGVEYIDPSSEVQDHIYVFKCHRQTIDDVDDVWPGNPLVSVLCTSFPFFISHTPSQCQHLPARYNTFASAGSDGTVSIWDHKVKK